MKNFFLYILRTYLLSVVAIALAVYVEALVMQYFYPPEQETPFPLQLLLV